MIFWAVLCRFIYRDGSKYEGQWQCGLRHGAGMYASPKGYTYEGEWVSTLCACMCVFFVQIGGTHSRIPLSKVMHMRASGSVRCVRVCVCVLYRWDAYVHTTPECCGVGLYVWCASRAIAWAVGADGSAMSRACVHYPPCACMYCMYAVPR